MRVTRKETEIWYGFPSLRIKNVYSMKGLNGMMIIPLSSVKAQILQN